MFLYTHYQFVTEMLAKNSINILILFHKACKKVIIAFHFKGLQISSNIDVGFSFTICQFVLK